jgi:geranylgeranyl pyrophosphate synthase
VIAARPTLLLALALEGSNQAERDELLDLITQCQRTADSLGKTGQTAEAIHAETGRIVQRVREQFEQAGVFDKAEKLIDKFRARAEAVADEIEPTELRELLYFLVDTVLDRQPPPEPEAPPLLQLTVT